MRRTLVKVAAAFIAALLVSAGMSDEKGTQSDLARLRGARVLLVEDSPLNRQVALEFLAEAGVQVDTAVNQNTFTQFGANPADVLSK